MRGILQTAIEKGAIRIVVLPGSPRQRGGKGYPAQRAEGPRHLGLPGIGDTPAALQCGLPQAQPSAVGHHAQLVPAPL